MLYDPKWEKKIETKTAEPWRDLLMRAAALMEERGHASGALQDRLGRVCLLGAINLAHTGDAYSSRGNDSKIARNAVARSLGFDAPIDAVAWNNAPGRTKDEVVFALRAAASA